MAWVLFKTISYANLVFYPMIIVGILTMIFGLLGIFDEIKRKKSLRKTR